MVTWIVANVNIEIGLPAHKSNRILRRPAPYGRVKVTSSESDQCRRIIDQTTREPKRLEPRVRVLAHVPPLVIINALCHSACCRVHGQSHAAQMIADHAIRHAVLGYVVRHVRSAAIHEAAHDIPAAVELRHRVQLVLVQPPLHQHAVHLPADRRVAMGRGRESSSGRGDP